MRLLCADRVLPVSSKPIEQGAVLIEDDRIAAVGSREDLTRAHPEAELQTFEGCVLLPGLVNAHTHLCLTHLHGAVPPSPFTEWLPELAQRARELTAADRERAAEAGALESLRAGVTLVGDIAYGPESAHAASRVGLAGVFFDEVLGFDEADMAAYEGQVDARFATETIRTRRGLSPHAPYTVGPRLITDVHRLAHRLSIPLAIHAAESMAELELLQSGSGPLATLAERLAHGFTAQGAGAVTYLHSLGALEATTLIHLGAITPSEIPVAARYARGAVSCPRSNRYLHNPVAPVRALRDAGMPVGLGTDSAASNEDLRLLREVAALAEADPNLPPHALIEMATLSGAISLGAQDDFGSLEHGKQADITVFETAGADPQADLVRRASSLEPVAVMTAGVWRLGV